MKTYSEKVTGKSFDWNEFLNKEEYTLDDFDYGVISRAHSWVTCACGQQCEIIPRMSDGCPRDQTLMCLGSSFFDHVFSMLKHFKNKHIFYLCRDAAKGTLMKIEERSQQLIDEITKEAEGKLL